MPLESFQVIQPSLLLQPYIRHYWVLEALPSLVQQRITPTGCIDLVFHKASRLLSTQRQTLQPSAFISGQSVQYTDLAQTGAVSMVVVVFQPYGARAFFKLPMDELSGLNVGFDELNDVALTELYDRVANESDTDKCIRLIEDELLKRLCEFKEYDYKRIAAIVSHINICSRASAASMAEVACLGYRQLNRVFTEYVGANPKDFLRVVRFHRALYCMQKNPMVSLTQLAYDCGFYDHSHMVKEFKALTGLTPSEYISFCPPHSDYFM